jgi:hypothetical protein
VSVDHRLGPLRKAPRTRVRGDASRVGGRGFSTHRATSVATRLGGRCVVVGSVRHDLQPRSRELASVRFAQAQSSSRPATRPARLSALPRTEAARLRRCDPNPAEEHSDRNFARTNVPMTVKLAATIEAVLAASTEKPDGERPAARGSFRSPGRRWPLSRTVRINSVRRLSRPNAI